MNNARRPSRILPGKLPSSSVPPNSKLLAPNPSNHMHRARRWLHDPICTTLPAPRTQAPGRSIALSVLIPSAPAPPPPRNRPRSHPAQSRHPPILPPHLALLRHDDPVQRDALPHVRRARRRRIAPPAARLDHGARVRRPRVAGDGLRRRCGLVVPVAVAVVGGQVLLARPRRRALRLVVLGDEGLGADFVLGAARARVREVVGAGAAGCRVAAAAAGLAGAGVAAVGFAGAVARGYPVEGEDGEEDCLS